MSYLEGDSLLKEIEKSFINDESEKENKKRLNNMPELTQAHSQKWGAGSSQTRPSSSMTYITQGSQARKRKKKKEMVSKVTNHFKSFQG